MEPNVYTSQENNAENDALIGDERPLDQALEDDTIRVMEHFIPYCGSPLDCILALQIKCREISKILRASYQTRLKACSMDSEQRDVESVLRSLKKTVSPKMASQIDSLLQIFQFNRMYQKFHQISREHPELVNMIAGNSSEQESSHKDIFSDPSLFMLLNAAGSGNENMDMTKLLTTLINRQG